MGSSCRYAVMVDAGFLKAQGARTLGLVRDDARFDGAGCLDWFKTFFRDSRFADAAEIVGDRTFLRAYWYDGAFDPSDQRYQRQKTVFNELALVRGLYLRLGHIQERRPSTEHRIRKAVAACGISLVDFQKHFEFLMEVEQKGVDMLMALDLVQLSRDRAVDVVLMLSGDRDMEEAVRIAQGAGCMVMVAYPGSGGVALSLRQLADALVPLDACDLATMLVPAVSQVRRALAS